MKSMRTKLTIPAILAALGSHAMAAPEANIDAQAVTARWAEQAFSALPPGVLQNRFLVLFDDEPVGSPRLNQSVTGKPLRLADKTYTRGIGVNATSKLRVDLAQPGKRFQADIGVDRNADGQVASVRFRVVAGGKEVFVSEVLRPGSLQSIDVPLNGARTVDLIIDDGGDGRTWDQANWCEPRIVLQDGSLLRLDELARQGGPVGGVPFSFVYGGKPSRELLEQWKSSVKDETVDAATRQRTLTFTDPETGLEVKAVAKIYLDTPGVDWTVYFTNTGPNDTPVLEQVRAVDEAISPPMMAGTEASREITGLMSVAERPAGLVAGNNPVLRRLNGTVGCVRFNSEDFAPVDDEITPGKRLEWGTPSAWSSFEQFPFYTLDWGSGGVVTALGWTGHWVASVDRSGAQMRMNAGMADLRTKLRPGESIRSPRILQVWWEGGNSDQAHNQFRQTMLRRIMPRRDGEILFPPLAFATTEENHTTEAKELAGIEGYKDVGFDVYWLDAWWIKGGHPKGMGYWGFPLERVHDLDRFPRGPKPGGDLAKRYGMGFHLWFAPEEIWPGSLLATEHPEWLLGQPPAPPNLGLPEVREFLTRYHNAAIKEYGLTGWRTDGGPSLASWRTGDTDPDRKGMTELRYVEGYYQMWDGMLAANPGLLIDNCAGGGTRIDLETSARSIALWRTDSAVWAWAARDRPKLAVLNQSINHGLNRYVPFSASMALGAEPYFFRSAFNGGSLFVQDPPVTDATRALLKQGLAEAKRLRKYLLGDFYPLTKPTVSAEAWCAYQYDLPATGEGAAFVFRRPGSPYYGYQLNLRGIDPAADYEVTEARTYIPEKPRRIKGAELQRYRANIDELPGSLLIEYKKLPPSEKSNNNNS